MTVEELRGMTHEDLVRRVQELEEANEKLAEEKKHGINLGVICDRSLIISRMRLKALF